MKAIVGRRAGRVRPRDGDTSIHARTLPPVWLFDLDNTLHDASTAAFREINDSMTAYIAEHLALSFAEADRLRRHYWLRYGATLLGLVRHHGVRHRHFLHVTHALPGLETRLRCHAHDRAALRALPGRKFVLTNAPAIYAQRVLAALGLAWLFDGVVSVEQMSMFGRLRPKPDRRMLRALAARLGVAPRRCVLVEDTLDHQRAARSVGYRTVWMQRWLRGPGMPSSVRLRRRPAYVDRRIGSLMDLKRRF